MARLDLSTVVFVVDLELEECRQKIISTTTPGKKRVSVPLTNDCLFPWQNVVLRKFNGNKVILFSPRLTWRMNPYFEGNLTTVSGGTMIVGRFKIGPLALFFMSIPLAFSILLVGLVCLALIPHLLSSGFDSLTPEWFRNVAMMLAPFFVFVAWLRFLWFYCRSQRADVLRYLRDEFGHMVTGDS